MIKFDVEEASIHGGIDTLVAHSCWFTAIL